MRESRVRDGEWAGCGKSRRWGGRAEESRGRRTGAKSEGEGEARGE